MWNLNRNQKIRAYGSYNSGANMFLSNHTKKEKDSCWTELWVRCNRCNMEYIGHDDCHEPQYKVVSFQSSPLYLETVNKRITNTVRVPESEYIMNKAAANTTQNIMLYKNSGVNPPVWEPKPTYAGDRLIMQWNQSSDRAYPSLSKLKFQGQNVPSHGSSTRTSLTRHRPGAGGPPGKGVDLKHNSYHRYLLKKKGLKNLRGERKSTYTSIPNFNKRVVNNKYKKDSIIANNFICPKCKFDNPCFNIQFNEPTGVISHTNYDHIKIKYVDCFSEKFDGTTSIIQVNNLFTHESEAATPGTPGNYIPIWELCYFNNKITPKRLINAHSSIVNYMTSDSNGTTSMPELENKTYDFIVYNNDTTNTLNLISVISSGASTTTTYYAFKYIESIETGPHHGRFIVDIIEINEKTFPTQLVPHVVTLLSTHTMDSGDPFPIPPNSVPPNPKLHVPFIQNCNCYFNLPENEWRCQSSITKMDTTAMEAAYLRCNPENIKLTFDVNSDLNFIDGNPSDATGVIESRILGVTNNTATTTDGNTYTYEALTSNLITTTATTGFSVSQVEFFFLTMDNNNGPKIYKISPSDTDLQNLQNSCDIKYNGISRNETYQWSTSASAPPLHFSSQGVTSVDFVLENMQLQINTVYTTQGAFEPLAGNTVETIDLTKTATNYNNDNGLEGAFTGIVIGIGYDLSSSTYPSQGRLAYQLYDIQMIDNVETVTMFNDTRSHENDSGTPQSIANSDGYFHDVTDVNLRILQPYIQIVQLETTCDDNNENSNKSIKIFNLNGIEKSSITEHIFSEKIQNDGAFTYTSTDYYNHSSKFDPNLRNVGEILTTISGAGHTPFKPLQSLIEITDYEDCE